MMTGHYFTKLALQKWRGNFLFFLMEKTTKKENFFFSASSSSPQISAN